MPAEESFSPEDEAFFEGADAPNSVRPVTLAGHEAPAEEADDASAPSRAVDPGRFVRPVQRVVMVLAALSVVALMREALRSPADGLAIAPAHFAPPAAPAFPTDALADDLTCSAPQVSSASDDAHASCALEPPVAFIGPPAPPAKMALTTVRAAPTKKVPSRTKSLSKAALLRAVRAQHVKAPLHK